jgi:hypothetical protein
MEPEGSFIIKVTRIGELGTTSVLTGATRRYIPENGILPLIQFQGITIVYHVNHNKGTNVL